MKLLFVSACSLVLLANPALAFSTKDTYQPFDERKAQDSLPMAKGEVWATLLKAKITYSDKVPHISAKLTPEIKAMAGKTLTVEGFMLPMDGNEKSSHFLLSKRTPTCPFCPPGEPNEVIEVYTTKPITFTDAMLTIQGKFQLTNNTENGIFFVIHGESVKK